VIDADDSSVRRFAVWTGILSALVAAGSMVVGLAALDFDFAAIGDPSRVLTVGAWAARPAYWSMLMDLFGYYLLLLPVTIVLWRDLRPVSPGWIDLASLAGVLYILIGASGAAILAAVWPPLIRAYDPASPDAAHVKLVFETFTAAVDRGLWNTLEITLAGFWWFTIGLRLSRAGFGWLSLVLGLACWIDSFATIAMQPGIANAGLSLYLILAPAWAVAAAFHIRRAT
jgi:hypothetical protein